MKRILVLALFLPIFLISQAGKASACGGSLAASLGLSNSGSCPVQDLGPPDDIYYVPPSAGPSYNQPGWVGIPQWQMPSGGWIGTPGVCEYLWYNVPVDHQTSGGPNGFNTYNPNASNTYSFGYGAAPGGANCNVAYEHLYIWQDARSGLETVMQW
jgi:hypothetical protein